MRVIDLTMSDVRAVDTRALLGEKLTLEEREAFAAEWKLDKGNPYQTKYWPLDMVLAACNRWAVHPVLTQTGKKRVRDDGGLSYDPLDPTRVKPKGVVAKAEPSRDRQEENRQRLEALKQRQGKVPAPTQKEEVPVAKPEPQDAVAEVERRRAALIALVDERIAQNRSGGDEDTRTLIASVASSAAGAAVATVLENEGRKLVDDARAMVVDLIEKARPVVLEIRRGDAPPVILDGPTHAVFEEVLELADEREEIALIGPTGSGKTHIARQVAEALGFDPDTQFAAQSCSGGMSESKIIGGLLPTGEGGKFEPFWTDFLRLYRDGGLFLADEWDGADENVALVVNQALANGYMDVMGLGRLHRHPDFVMMVAMNTFGTGANRMYVGRNQLDEATLDRFRMGQVEMDYDRKLEQALVKKLGGDDAWLQACWKVRDAINRQKLRRNMSTRFILKGIKMQRGKGWSIDKCMGKFVLGWSQDEKDKAGLSHV